MGEAAAAQARPVILLLTDGEQSQHFGGASAAIAFQAVSVDEAATLDRLADATVTLVVTTAAPSVRSPPPPTPQAQRAHAASSRGAAAPRRAASAAISPLKGR